MTISIIAAIGKNFEIGKDNDLPWKLSSDLKLFKKTTSGHHILMGRKNFESMGRALPKRTNIVITRDQHWYQSNVDICHSLEAGIQLAKDSGEDELFIIGGGTIYEQALPYVTRFYISHVNVEIPGADVFFPTIDFSNLKELSSVDYLADDKNQYNFSFKIYER